MNKRKSFRHPWVISFLIFLGAVLPSCGSSNTDHVATPDSFQNGSSSDETSSPSGSGSTPAPAPSTEADEVLALTNQSRAASGIAPLTMNAKLQAAAQAYAEAMATENFFSHTAPDGSTPDQRIEAQGYVWTTWGENIAMGYTTASTTMTGWMNSSGHRANILNGAFKEIGIGHSAIGGTHYWVQDFGTSR